MCVLGGAVNIHVQASNFFYYYLSVTSGTETDGEDLEPQALTVAAAPVDTYDDNSIFKIMVGTKSALS